MKTRIAAFLNLAVMSTACPATPEANHEKLPDEVRAGQIRDMKWGMFICRSFSTFHGQERTPTRDKDAEGTFKGYQVAEFTYPILPPHRGGATWFYSLPEHDNLCHPAEKVFTDYQGAMKHGNIFSINVGPDYAGKLRDIDVKTLKQVGEMIRSSR